MRNLKKFLALVLAMMMVFSLMVTVHAADTFTDAASANEAYQPALEALYKAGALQGYDDGNFEPSKSMTRKEFAAILYRLISGDVEEKDAKLAQWAQLAAATYSDIKADAYYAGPVGYLYENDIMVGVSNTEFGKNNTITGQQVLIAMLRAVGLVKDDKELTDENPDMAWSDVVIEAMNRAEDYHLVDTLASADKGSRNLKNPATRQVVAQLMIVAFTMPTYEYRGTTSDGTIVFRTDGGTLGEAIGLKAVSGGDAAKADADPFGRPAASAGYVIGDKFVATAKPAVAWSTHSEITDEGAAMYKALKSEAGEEKINLYVDGALDEGDKALKDILDADGNGVLIEVYTHTPELDDKGEPKDDIDFDVVIINTYAVVLTEDMFVPADEDAETDAYIDLGDGVTYPDNGDFAEDDVVLVTLAYDTEKSTEEAAVYNVFELKKISASVSGVVTHAGDDYIRIDSGSTKYYLAENAVDEYTLPDPTADEVKGKTYGLYLDSYGYVVYGAVGKVADPDDDVEYPSAYVYVDAYETNVPKDGGDKTTGGALIPSDDSTAPIVKAQVVDLTTGETSIIDIAVGQKSGKWYYLDKQGAVSKIEVADTDTDKDGKEGAFVLCTDLGDGTYVLGDGTATAVEDISKFVMAKKTPTVTVADKTDVNALKTTTLTILTVTEVEDDEGEKSNEYSVETVTGYTNFPAIKGEQADDNLQATAASYLTNTAGSVTAFYVAVKGEAEKVETVGVFAGAGEKSADGTAYNFYVNGVSIPYYSEEELKAGDKSLDIGALYTITVKGDEITVAAVEKGDTYIEDYEVSKVTSEYIESEKADGEAAPKSIYLADEYYVLQLTEKGKTVAAEEEAKVDGVKTSTISKAEGHTVNVYLNKDGEAVLIIIQVDPKGDE